LPSQLEQRRNSLSTASHFRFLMLVYLWSLKHHRLKIENRNIGQHQVHFHKKRFGNDNNESMMRNGQCKTQTLSYDWEKYQWYHSRQFVMCPNKCKDHPRSQKQLVQRMNYSEEHHWNMHLSIH